MRIVIFLIILIVVSSGLYTFYGIASFEPEKPAALVFQEPSAEELKNMGVLPETKPAGPVLTLQQKEQADLALAKISKAVSVYQGYEQAAPLQLKDTLSIFNAAIGSGKLPAYFLGAKDPRNAKRELQLVRFNPMSALKSSATEPDLNCDGDFNVLIGDENKNALSCNAPDAVIDDIFLGGPGNDMITDAAGSRIVNAGAGNDTINLGSGRSLIILEPDWGQDLLTIDCNGATINPSEIPVDPVPWVYKFSNFIMVSSRIPEDALTWKGNVLTNTISGDTLTVNQNCFNLVRAAE